MKQVWFFILIIIISGLAGVLASQLLTPYLAHTPPFNKISWLKKVNNGTTIVNLKEEKVINESTAIEDSISKLSQSVVGVESRSILSAAKKKTAKGISIYGTGFLTTSDGLILTASSSVPKSNFEYYVHKNGEEIPAEINKRDDKTGLVLLKISKTNLPVVSLAELKDLRLGARVILLATDAESDPIERFTDLGIIRALSEKRFIININSENEKASGSPLFTITGEVAGMVQVDEGGAIKIIPADIIRSFLAQ